MGVLLAAAGLCAELALAQSPKLSYPPARKAELTEELFGVKVSDPYRWMEDTGSAELNDWLAAQGRLTSGYLGELPLRAHFQKRITELWNYSKTYIPIVEGGRFFYRRNEGLQQQTAIYMREGLGGPRQLVLDSNAISPDGSTAIADFRPSPDGKLLLYALAEGGADWQTLRVRDLESGRELADEVKWVRFSWLSWTRDSKGFFYSRYPEPPPGRALTATLGDHALYYHRVGTPQSEDFLVYQRLDIPRAIIGAWVPREGRYLFVRVNDGSGPVNRLYFKDLADPEKPDVRAAVKPLAENAGTDYTVLGSVGPIVYVRTDDAAPTGASSPSTCATRAARRGRRWCPRAKRRSGSRVTSAAAWPSSTSPMCGAAWRSSISKGGRRVTFRCRTWARSPELAASAPAGSSFTSLHRCTNRRCFSTTRETDRSQRSKRRAYRSTFLGTRRSACSPFPRTARGCRSSSPHARI
jgi:hypothetical protein